MVRNEKFELVIKVGYCYMAKNGKVELYIVEGVLFFELEKVVKQIKKEGSGYYWEKMIF